LARFVSSVCNTDLRAFDEAEECEEGIARHGLGEHVRMLKGVDIRVCSGLGPVEFGKTSVACSSLPRGPSAVIAQLVIVFSRVGAKLIEDEGGEILLGCIRGCHHTWLKPIAVIVEETAKEVAQSADVIFRDGHQVRPP